LNQKRGKETNLKRVRRQNPFLVGARSHVPRRGGFAGWIPHTRATMNIASRIALALTCAVIFNFTPANAATPSGDRTADHSSIGVVSRDAAGIAPTSAGVSLVVTTIDDHDDGVCAATDCTLREAITASNASGGGTITFSPGLTGMIELGAPLPNISANLQLDGPGANFLTIRRSTGGEYRIFTISNGTESGPTVSLFGLTISNGVAPDGEFPDNSGGGILNDRGTLSIDRCTVTANNSAAGLETFGGGIFNREGDVVVSASTVAGNSARLGAGIASSRGRAGTTHALIIDSTISGNTSAGGEGGGVYNAAESVNAGARMKLINCTLSGNEVAASFLGSFGGAIFNSGMSSGSATFEIVDCTISGNSATNGGGVYNFNSSGSASVHLLNTIVKAGTTGVNLFNAAGVITSLGHNISSDDAAGGAGTVGGGFLNGIGDVRNTDPLLGALQDNGGPTQTHALLNGSAAINAGVSTGENAGDQRGFSRTGINDVGAFEFGAATPAVELRGVVSRKTHGGAGTFEVEFPLSGTPGVECRSGGGSGSFQVVLKFAHPLVSVDSAAITAGAGAVHPSSGIGIDPHEFVINVTGVSDGQVITAALTNIRDEDGFFSSGASVQAGFLLGDANGDGSVNSGDALLTRSRSGQPVDATNFRSDFTSDGMINSGDAIFVRSRSGNTIQR
jgi:CSLREA domain-containing protein